MIVPAAAELITAVHEPLPPEVVQVLGPTNEAEPETIEKLIVVPFGAFTKPPVPVFTSTCPVSVWFVPIGLIADGGVI
jgi:hypothetical protein